LPPGTTQFPPVIRPYRIVTTSTPLHSPDPDGWLALRELAPDFVALLESNEGIRHLAPSIEAILGILPDVSQDWPPTLSVLSRSWESLDALLDVDNLVRTRFHYQHDDGKWYTLEIMARGISGLTPQRGAIISVHDVTRRIELENSLRAARTEADELYNTASSGYLSTDTEGVITRINDTALSWLGYTYEELIGRKNIRDLLMPDSRLYFDQNHSGPGTTASEQNIEYEFRRKDGSLLPVLLGACDIRNELGQYAGSRCSIQDISERKRAELVLGRVIGALRVLGEVNTELTHFDQELALLDTVCRVIVESGGYLMACVEYRQSSSDKMLRRVAQAGGDPIHPGESTTERESPNKEQGTVFHAMRSGHPQINRDTSISNKTAESVPVYASSVALPLHDQSGNFGVLLIHSNDVNALDPRELELLEQLAENLSFGIRTLRSQKLQQAALDQSRKRLQALSSRIVTLQDDERRALAAELHDHVGQSLSALSINLSLIGSQLQTKNDEPSSILDDSRRLLESIGKTIRQVIGQLRPAVLEDYGLLAALRWNAEAFEKRTGVSCLVTGEERSLELPLKAALLRVAQESLSNAGKHAAATHLNIVLRVRLRGGVLLIEDDGCGFDPAVLTMPGKLSRWGLMMMRERIESVGGRLRIRSAPGQGTSIVATWRTKP
jgi:PAS domain S-box-containing protein